MILCANPVRSVIIACLCCVLPIVLSNPCFAEDRLSTDDFHSLIKKGDHQVWHRFRDFGNIIATFTKSEKKDYEWAQRASLLSDQKGKELIEDYDLMGFKRAYPHLAPAFSFAEVERAFYKHYHEKYSYGQLRRHAWFSRRLADPGTQNEKRFDQSVFLDQARSYSKKKQGVLPSEAHFLALGFDQLTVLAVCAGYRPAILDVMKAAWVQQQLKLAPVLSYLLFLRVQKEDGLRLIDKEHWLAHIDKTLSSKDKIFYEQLIKDKDKLYGGLEYCSY